MNRLRRSLLLAFCLVAAACATPDRQIPSAPVDADSADRQILVMLRAPRPHFRPDASYSSVYGSKVRQGAGHRIAEELAARHDLRLVDAWPMPALGLDCFVMQVPERVSTALVVGELARDTRVESAQAMNVFHVLGHNDPLFALQPGAAQWHLAEVHRIATGRNVRIAEVDTGVEADHPDLRGRVALTRNFVDGPPGAGEAHGTAVAGIIAARADDGIGIAGVAPDSLLYTLRACRQGAGDTAATCTSFTLAKALQFALEQKVQVINLSLGGPHDRLLERLLDVAVAHRIVIVSAVDPTLGDGGFPASLSGVLAVAAQPPKNGLAGVLIAPGRDIPTTTPGQTWGFVTGSSYATAHVSGAVALLLERAPELDARQVRSVLAAGGVTGAVLGDARPVDVCAAIARTTSACVCDCVLANAADSTVTH